MEQEIPRLRRPRIWAVGGGKGGVGKSAITASLGVALARRNLRCVLVDADLGGANLHTMVGVPAPARSLSEIFTRDVANLEALRIPTDIPNLELISGAHALIDMANPKHLQKQKVIRQLFTLNADFVLLDLSAGSSFNVVDFFLAADEPITVVVPTPTSIENAYHFLKATFYRRLKGAIVRAGAAAIIDQAFEQQLARGIRSPRELVQHLRTLDASIGAAVAREMSELRPKLIVNQIRRNEELNLGEQIALACRDYFGVEMTFLGGVHNDDRVVSSIQMRKPVITAYPHSPFASAVEALAQQLIAPRPEGGL
jgi:flagellar biosynthesis protein FlhG